VHPGEAPPTRRTHKPLVDGPAARPLRGAGECAKQANSAHAVENDPNRTISRKGVGEPHSSLRHARLAQALNDAFALRVIGGIVSLHTGAIAGDGEAGSERKSGLDRLTRLIQPTELR